MYGTRNPPTQQVSAAALLCVFVEYQMVQIAHYQFYAQNEVKQQLQDSRCYVYKPHAINISVSKAFLEIAKFEYYGGCGDSPQKKKKKNIDSERTKTFV